MVAVVAVQLLTFGIDHGRTSAYPNPLDEMHLLLPESLVVESNAI
jgi:hypothetical protein